MIEGIWLYLTISLVIILVILSLVLVIRRRGDITAKKKVLDAFKEKGYIVEEEKEDKSAQEKKIIDELIFFTGTVLLVSGFLKENYYVLFTGLALMFFSLFLLHSLLKKQPKDKKDLKKEKRIVGKIDSILKKEAALKMREQALKREIEELYKKARELKGKELQLNKKEDQIKKKEIALEKPTIIVEKGLDEDVKKVLKITDDLLERLPDEEIDKFSKTKEFELYKKVIRELK